ncbi:MAG: hypothetical protein J3K34DRAFT_518952 [Monoraphidium minutum]|nr:MAG: hypothetical protein J3K34DRAFT_518952 [Monoraphidium minutum]
MAAMREAARGGKWPDAADAGPRPPHADPHAPAPPPRPRPPRRGGSAPPAAAAAAAAVVVLLAAALWWRGEHHAITSGGPNAASSKMRAWLAGVAGDTLVFYVYRPNDDAEAANNLNFFILGAMLDDYRCDYVVLDSPLLPQLPRSGRYLFHDRACSEWGLMGWALDPAGGGVEWGTHAYFVLVSGAFRGPFLPSYLQPYVHWVEPLVSRLDDDVRLAAATLSCQPAQQPPGNASSPWRKNPRAAPGAVVTDRDGLKLLMADGQVLGCHTTPAASAYYSDAGAVAAVLRAGFNVDSLLSRFQGVDWRDERNWGCNGGIDPAGTEEYAYDGTWLDPFEAMFVRVKAHLLLHRLPSAAKAVRLSSWEAAVIVDRLRAAAREGVNVSARIAGNDYKQSAARFKLPRVLTALVRGMSCFDVDFFVARNADVRSQSQYPHVVWRFFVYMGQFEDRAYRYTCPMNYDDVAKPAF